MYLRKGVKWSDGHPFTVDDIIFYFEDVVGNDELAPVKPVYWRPGGEMPKLTKIDDYTLQFDFAVPFPVAHMYLLSKPVCKGRSTYPSTI